MPWTAPAPPVTWEDSPHVTTPVDATNLNAMQTYAATVGQSIVNYANPPLLPSGADDTTLINGAIALGQSLGVGTFSVSGTIVGYPRGQGAGKTILLATNSAAGIQAGGVMTGGPAQDFGTYGAFTFNGAGIVTGPLLLSNTVGTTLLPILLQNGAGDGLVVSGQNCTFIGTQAGQCAGCAFVMDGGAGGNMFVNFEFTGATLYHMEFRETFTPSTYPVPSENVFIGGRTEYAFGNITTGPNAGCIHMLAGNHNKFIHCDFDTPTGTRHVYAEPNTFTARSTDWNGRNIFDACGFTSGSTNLTSCIAASASLMNGDSECITLRGSCTFSTTAAVPAVLWANPINYVRLDGRYNLYQNVTALYTVTGAGTALRYGNSTVDWVGSWTLGTNVTDGGADLSGFALGGIVDGAGFVRLTGTLKVGGSISANATLATLPAQLRPARGVFLPVIIWQSGATTGIAAYLTVNSTGVLNMGTALTSGQYVMLDGHSYPLTR